METNERDLICYNLLNEVYTDGTFASLQLNSSLGKIKDERDKAYISELFYGVLEKNVQFDYIIKRLVSKKPKTSVELIIKIGLYHLRYMSTPAYASIDNAVELAKTLGKSGVAGFINAVLRGSIKVELPSESERSAEYLSVNYSVPLWLCNKLIGEYGYDFTHEFLGYEISKKTHVRYNSRLITKEEFEEKISKFGFERSKLGYYVTHNMLQGVEKSLFTTQSLSSMIAVQCYADSEAESPVVLDLCGAPGGKSIYFEELKPNSKIYCCDIRPHRVELIKKYAQRMKSKIVPLLMDATKLFPEWVGKCDVVICDVPCSGIGVYKNKPDILFNKKESDIAKIKATQKNILLSAKEYVKVGGKLCYSTCTVLKEENEEVINEFLAENKGFELEKINSPFVGENNGMVKLFPHTDDGCDGFFVASLRRKA